MIRPKTTHVDKPWGFFDQYALNAVCTVKILTCNPGQGLSLQRHSHRDELWIVLDDGAIVELDGKCLYPKKGEEIWIPSGSLHRLRCNDTAGVPLRILEVSYGEFDENDIERLNDEYGRAE